MELELKIKGTPAKFAVMVELFDWRLLKRHKENGPRFHVPGFVDKIPTDTNYLHIHFTNAKGSGYGSITAQSTPDDKTLLTVWVKDDEWSEFEPSWILLCEEMGRQGWLSEEIASNDYPYPLPETKSRVDEWKKAYKVVLRVREDRRFDWDNGEVPSPNPTIDEYRDACELDIKWKPDPKVMRAIEYYGDKGRLM